MIGNDAIGTAALTPARIRLFQPLQRPKIRTSEWLETSWGKCRVHGRLGQRHADLIEATQYCAEVLREEDSGTVRLLVDPARVRRVMSDGNYSLQQIWSLFRDMIAAVIEIDTPALKLMGGLIDSVEYTKKETRFDPLTGGQRRLWTVRLGKAWTELMRRDRVICYDPSPIIRLEHGISQAIARFLFTHSLSSQPNGGWKLDGLIAVLAGELSNQQLRDARRWLREDSSKLNSLGIEFGCGNRVMRRHDPNSVAWDSRPETWAMRP